MRLNPSEDGIGSAEEDNVIKVTLRHAQGGAGRGQHGLATRGPWRGHEQCARGRQAGRWEQEVCSLVDVDVFSKIGHRASG